MNFNAQRSAELGARRMRRAGLERLPREYDVPRWREAWEAAGIPLERGLTEVGWPPTWKGRPLEVGTRIPAGWVELLPVLARCTETERGYVVRWCGDREFFDSLRVQLRLARARGESALELLRDIGWARMVEREVATFPRHHSTNRGRAFSGTATPKDAAVRVW